MALLGPLGHLGPEVVAGRHVARLVPHAEAHQIQGLDAGRVHGAAGYALPDADQPLAQHGLPPFGDVNSAVVTEDVHSDLRHGLEIGADGGQQAGLDVVGDHVGQALLGQPQPVRVGGEIRAERLPRVQPGEVDGGQLFDQCAALVPGQRGG